MDKDEFYRYLEKGREVGNETSQKFKALLIDYPYFQAAAFLYLQYLKKESDPNFDSELKRIAIRIPDRKKLYDFFHQQRQLKTNRFEFEIRNTQNDYKLEQGEINEGRNELIDRFLSASPGMIERKSDSEEEALISDKSDILRNSESEISEMITETLAMIYFQQKKYNKALEAFRKLSLKYPEKSVYFASRIEEIEKLKNL